MAIRVLFFASLREAFGCSELSLDADQYATVGEVWEQVSGDRAYSGSVLNAVNMEYAALDAPVHDGDEVAFFPPVTGGAA